MADPNTTGLISCEAGTTINCSLSAECAPRLLYDTVTLVTTLAVMPAILACGLVGNLAFLGVTARVGSMRTVTNAYLANLAVSDVLFLVSSVGDKVARYLVTPFRADQLHLGVAGCTGLYILQHLFNWVSIFLVTLVSLERYYGVCHPLKHMALHTSARTWKLIGAAWLVALVFSLLMVPAHSSMLHFCIVWPDGDQYADFANLIGLCAATPGQDWMGTVSNLFQTIPFFFAMGVSCFAYTKIVWALSNRSEEIMGLSRTAISKTIRVRNQVSVMLIANGVTFFVCLAPFQLYSAAAAIRELSGGPESFGEVYVQIARMLLYLNSAVNPYIYGLTNSTYRRSFREAFVGRDPTRRRHGLTASARRLNVAVPWQSHQQNGSRTSASRKETFEITL